VHFGTLAEIWFILGCTAGFFAPTAETMITGAYMDSTEQTGSPPATGDELDNSRSAESLCQKTNEILELIAIGRPAGEIYDAIALMYEGRHPGMRCSMLELDGKSLLHGGAPSMPREYCEAVHGLEIGPSVGSCGTSTFTGERCLVENIETDPKWESIRHHALPHGMRSCWSEPIKSSLGKVLGAFGMYYDQPALPDETELEDLVSAARLAGIVMERDQDQKSIRRLAFTDELTGLANRAHFYQELEKLIKKAKRYNSEFGLLYLDLDDFKGINDSLGHDVGDHLLREIASRLKELCRETDFVARLSGDEFCIVVENLEDEGATAHLARRCLEAIGQPIELSARKYQPNCSIGIAHYPEDGTDTSTLVKAADTALYAAKGRGKSQYAFYQVELTLNAEHRALVELHLREAIEKQQLTIAYQPQIDIASGRIVGVEALCRWRHQLLGQVPPTEFIATAERIGMIKPLTDWVMNTACSQLVAWKQTCAPDLKLSVNISASYFLDPDIIALVRQAIDDTGVAPADIVFEVTESAVQANPENLAVFQVIKSLGIALAIDDFGMGYSSFASLKHLQVDYLKIDRYFVEDMNSDEKSAILVRSMITMGHDLGHQIVAEGVETQEQLAMLREMGCKTAQGFYFSEALPPEEITALLQAES
jgi:diguanylate cyclase (GGDEF)-like protein